MSIFDMLFSELDEFIVLTQGKHRPSRLRVSPKGFKDIMSQPDSQGIVRFDFNNDSYYFDGIRIVPDYFATKLYEFEK